MDYKEVERRAKGGWTQDEPAEKIVDWAESMGGLESTLDFFVQDRAAFAYYLQLHIPAGFPVNPIFEFKWVFFYKHG